MRAISLLLCLLCGAALVPVQAAMDAVAAPAAVTEASRPSAGVPLGGIGTGKVELLPDGTLGNLTLNNNWDRPIAELPGSFFAIRTTADQKTTARVLATRSPYKLPAVKSIRYQGVFPKADLQYTDPELPVEVSLEARSSLVPQNVKDSSLPAATFEFTLRNPGKAAVETAVAFSWENALGRGGTAAEAWSDRTGNTQAIHASDGHVGLLFAANQNGEGRRQNALGQYALIGEAEGGRTTSLSFWNAQGDGADFWTAFTAPTLFGEKPQARPGQEGSVHPAGTVAVQVNVPAGGTSQVRFYLAWHMPRWITADGADQGHQYAEFYSDAWSAAHYAAQYRETLAKGTSEWQELLLKSSLPEWLKNRVLNDLFPLVTNTLHTKEGRFTLLENSGEGSSAAGGLDRWMMTRSFLAALYPALEQSELKLFGDRQAQNGEMRRLLGTADEGFGIAGSPAGATGWPDVTCNYVLGIYRQYRWTGDAEPVKAVYPTVKRALQWLATRDSDGDGIPEGGSTWSYQHYPGTFVYTAGMYLAALRAGERMARVNADKKMEDELRGRFREARDNAMEQLWNGRYFTKFLDPVSGQRSTNLFAGALAGEWAGGALGLPEQLDTSVVDTAVRTLLELLPRSTRQGAPNELRTDGTPEPGLSEVASVGHLETYLGALAISRGRTDAGLDLLKRIHAAQREGDQSPWDASTGYNPLTAERAGSRWDTGAMASWNVFSAITGVTLDEPGGALSVAPGAPASWNGLHAPIFTPRYWAWMDYARSGINAATNLRLKLVRKFDERPVLLNSLTTDAQPGVALDDMIVLVTGPAGKLEGKGEIRGGKLTYTFKTPFEWRPSETLEMTLVPPDANNIVLQFDPARVLSYGSEVTARDLEREGKIRFTLVNPTRERQVVNVRFRNAPEKNYEVFQNGTQLERFTPDTPGQRLSLVVPASPIGYYRIEALRSASARLQSAREEASRTGKLPSLEAQFDLLQEKIRDALRADETARTSKVMLNPYRRNVFIRSKLKELPPIVTPEDPEPAVLAAETAIADAPKALAEKGVEPAVRGLLLGALTSVRAGLSAKGELTAGGTVVLTAAVTNESRQPVSATVELTYPEGWTGPAAAPRVSLNAGETKMVEIPVRLPLAVEPKRHQIAGRVTFETLETSWAAPLAVAVGRGYLRDWSVIGVWEGPGAKALAAKLPPDTELDPTRAYEGRKWRVVRGMTDRFDLAEAFGGGTRGVAYAVTQLFSPMDQEAFLELSTDCGVAVKVNGVSALERASGAPRLERISMRLRQGWNTILLKLARSADRWGFHAEVVDEAGNTPSGLRFNPDLAR